MPDDKNKILEGIIDNHLRMFEYYRMEGLKITNMQVLHEFNTLSRYISEYLEANPADSNQNSSHYKNKMRDIWRLAACDSADFLIDKASDLYRKISDK